MAGDEGAAVARGAPRWKRLSWCQWFGSVLTFIVAVTAAPAQSVPPIDTSGWKTYRNESMGFETKYPSTWSVGALKGTAPENVMLGGPPRVEGSNLRVQFWVQRQMNPNGLSIQQWYADQLSRQTSRPLATAYPVIGGRAAVRMEMVGSLSRMFSFFVALNKTDVFQITIDLPPAQTRLDPTYEALLSTFRFIE
ncbi:MAG: hypothetical protein DMD94_18810 [Candidatus Rokuibacteriota bacterium]|nr:MAG: hypothetical protein DMD94_18810 [Candidatus Rokubacteria bacterium]